MIWKTVNNKDLVMTDMLLIAGLKNQHWQYGIDSQVSWMKENIGINDTHLMGMMDDGDKLVLKAYTTLSAIHVVVDNKQYDCVGVGGVCVDKEMQHIGIGQLLINEANKFINAQNRMGILLCKDELVPFYKKCGWKKLQYQTALVAGNNFEHIIMLLDKDVICSNIIIEKNF